MKLQHGAVQLFILKGGDAGQEVQASAKMNVKKRIQEGFEG
jgi:hypothetical protein